VRVVGVVVHRDDDVITVVEASSVHVTDEIDQRMVVAQKHVYCNRTRGQSNLTKWGTLPG